MSPAARRLHSLAATLSALPSISEVPFLDSCAPAFLFRFFEAGVSRYGRGSGVGRGLGVGWNLGVGVGLGVAVAVAVAVAVGVAVAVAVAVGVAVAVAVGLGLAVGVGVGVPPVSTSGFAYRSNWCNVPFGFVPSQFVLSAHIA